MKKRYTSFSKFYPYYLSAHGNCNCRRLHFAGIVLVLLFIALALATVNWTWSIATPFAGYGLGWLGHALFEKNRPTTFDHPCYSILGDWMMCKDMLVGKIKF
jgi:hypothetical protein